MIKNRFHIQCPHCSTKMLVDRSTGEVISFEIVKTADSVSFEERLNDLEKQKERSDEIFSQQMKAYEDKDRLLEEKFKEAIEKSKKSDLKKPIKDIDLD